MRDLLVLFVHLVVTTVRLMRPGGARAIVAESLLLKQQLLIATRSRRRAPDLRPLDRIVAGLCAGLVRRARLHRCVIVLKPATILRFQRLLVRRKYRELFSSKRRGRPGPKGPSAESIAAIVEMKRRNPRFGYQRIADQVALAFDVPVDKHLVRRVLARHYRPDPGSGAPSWLTFLGHSKDSLWSVDPFRCESLILRTHWVMVVLDQYTRRIVGFAVCQGSPDGPTVCRMLFHIICGSAPPTYLSSDHDPLFEYHRWKANLRILGVKEVKRFPLHRFHTHSWNVWLGRSGANISTRCRFGTSTTSNENWTRSRNITTVIGCIRGSRDKCPTRELAAKTSQQFASMTTGGNLTVAAYFNYQWRLELEFAPHR